VYNIGLIISYGRRLNHSSNDLRNHQNFSVPLNLSVNEFAIFLNDLVNVLASFLGLQDHLYHESPKQFIVISLVA
jgi:hypothetical protein